MSPFTKVTRTLWFRAFAWAILLCLWRYRACELDVRVDGVDRAFPGRVVEIASRAEFTPRAALTERERADLVFGIKVQADSQDVGGRLKAGMPVTLELELLP